MFAPLTPDLPFAYGKRVEARCYAPQNNSKSQPHAREARARAGLDRVVILQG